MDPKSKIEKQIPNIELSPRDFWILLVTKVSYFLLKKYRILWITMPSLLHSPIVGRITLGQSSILSSSICDSRTLWAFSILAVGMGDSSKKLRIENWELRIISVLIHHVEWSKKLDDSIRNIILRLFLWNHWPMTSELWAMMPSSFLHHSIILIPKKSEWVLSLTSKNFLHLMVESIWPTGICEIRKDTKIQKQVMANTRSRSEHIVATIMDSRSMSSRISISRHDTRELNIVYSKEEEIFLALSNHHGTNRSLTLQYWLSTSSWHRDCDCMECCEEDPLRTWTRGIVRVYPEREGHW